MDVRVGLWRKLSAEELMLLNCGVGEDSWESKGLQGDLTIPFWRRSVQGVLWKDWWGSWNSNTSATSCEELTHWKRPWCWEGLGAGGEGDDRGWDGWMASLTRWTWVWVNSGNWWWTGRLGMVQFMGSQSWTRLSNWTELNWWEQWKERLRKETAILWGKWNRIPGILLLTFTGFISRVEREDRKNIHREDWFYSPFQVGFNATHPEIFFQLWIWE